MKNVKNQNEKVMRLDHGVFNFWKENKVDGFFQLTEDELRIRFVEWMEAQPNGILAYYSTSDNVAHFIADKEDGLNSVGNTEHDFAEYRTMEKILKPILKAHLSGHDVKLDLKNPHA